MPESSQMPQNQRVSLEVLEMATISACVLESVMQSCFLLGTPMLPPAREWLEPVVERRIDRSLPEYDSRRRALVATANITSGRVVGAGHIKAPTRER